MLFWTVLLFRIINVIDNIFNRYIFLFSYRLPDGFTMLLSLTHVYLNDTFLDFLPANIGRYVVLFDFIVNEQPVIPQKLPVWIIRENFEVCYKTRFSYSLNVATRNIYN